MCTFFDSDCKIKKYVDIPQNIFKINIIPMNNNMRKTCVEDICDYEFTFTYRTYSFYRKFYEK